MLYQRRKVKDRSNVAVILGNTSCAGAGKSGLDSGAFMAATGHFVFP